jgi:hypothetical protein
LWAAGSCCTHDQTAVAWMAHTSQQAGRLAAREALGHAPRLFVRRPLRWVSSPLGMIGGCGYWPCEDQSEGHWQTYLTPDGLTRSLFFHGSRYGDIHACVAVGPATPEVLIAAYRAMIQEWVTADWGDCPILGSLRFADCLD